LNLTAFGQSFPVLSALKTSLLVCIFACVRVEELQVDDSSTPERLHKELHGLRSSRFIFFFVLFF
jgi:hypothetical protein